MPEESQPLTVEDARKELEQIQAWLQNVAHLQQQVAGVNLRAALLTGFLLRDETLTEVATTPPTKRPRARAT